MLISGASSFIMSFSTQLVKIILSEGKTPAVMFYAFAFQFNFSFTPPPRKWSLTRASAFIFYSAQVSYIHRRCSGLDRMPGDETPCSGDGVWHRRKGWLGVCVGIVLDLIFFSRAYMVEREVFILGEMQKNRAKIKWQQVRKINYPRLYIYYPRETSSPHDLTWRGTFLALYS